MKNALATFMRIARMAMFVIGPIFLLVAAILALGTRSFLQHATRARATITALELRTDPEDQTVSYYYPRFVFTTPDGRPFSISSNTGTNPPAFKLGQRVDVLYDPANPGDARIDTAVQLWLVPMVLSFIGLVFICIAAVFLMVERRRAAKAVPPLAPVTTSTAPPPIEP
jgi:hypothetical protein